MKSSPLVTILVPTYHRPEKLRLAIRSVLSQKYENFILRISDNGSDEQTKLICEEFVKSDSRVIYRRNIKNIGMMENFNKLIDSVETKYYCILSDDDFLFDNFLEDNIPFLEKNKNVMFSCSNCLIIDEKRNIKYCSTLDWGRGVYKPSSTVIHKMAKSCFTSTAVVFRTELNESLDGFHKLGDDFIILLKLCAAYEFHVTASYGAAFTISQDSYTSLGGIGAQSSLVNLCTGLLCDLEFVKNNIKGKRQTLVTLIVVMRYVNYFSKRYIIWILSGTDSVFDADSHLNNEIFSKKAMARRGTLNYISIFPKKILKLIFSIHKIKSKFYFIKNRKNNNNELYYTDKLFKIENWNLDP